MAPQVEHIQLLPHGSSESAPVLVINGHSYRIGDCLNSFGILDCPLSDRLLRIVVFLGLRRLGGCDQGWTAAEDISVLVEGKASAGGVRKFLERYLRSYGMDDLVLSPQHLPKTHLIQYMPRRSTATGLAYGLSRGPYRLGPGPERIRCDQASCRSYLLQRPCLVAASPLEICDPETLSSPLALIEECRPQVGAGQYADARRFLLGRLQATYLSPVRVWASSSTKGLAELGECWALVANIEMQMGLSDSAFQTAHHAHVLCKEGRHPRGVAGALQVAAHGLYQLGQPAKAVGFAKEALFFLDNSGRSYRRGCVRAGYIGARGIFRSAEGNFQVAERDLAYAKHTNEAGGRTDWATVWGVRLAENALQWGEITDAEKWLCQVDAGELDTSGYATYCRVMAAFEARVGRHERAAEWVRTSLKMVASHGMSDLGRRLAPLLEELGRQGIMLEFP